MSTGLLSGVKALDIGERISGPYCARILADLGAEVIKVEPPQGDEARSMGPFPGDVPHPDKSGLFLALNANKYGVTLDLTSLKNSRRLGKLLESTDVLVDNLPPERLDTCGLGYKALREAYPALVVTSIGPFGTRGPYARYKASDLVLFHMSGYAHAMQGPVADPERTPPVRAGGHQAEFVAGLAAATATMMALYRKKLTGEGCHVETSAFHAMVTQMIGPLAEIAHGKAREPRKLGENKSGGASGVLPCNDGFVAISPREEAQWERWLEVMGAPEWGSDERFATRESRQENSAALLELMSAWSRRHSKHDIARWGQERRVACFAVNTVADMLEDQHLADRQFFIERDHPVAGALRYPGTAYQLSSSPPPATRPAPLLGQHNDDILGGLE